MLVNGIILTCLVPVIQNVDSAVHRIIYIHWITQLVSLIFIHWIVIYLVDSAIQFLLWLPNTLLGLMQNVE